MDDMKKRALWREWWISLTVIVVGFVIAIAVAGYFAITNKVPQPVTSEQTASAPTASGTAQGSGDPRQVCVTALTNAKNYGVLPAFAQVTDGVPHETKVQGRYTCDAKTPSAKYSLTADLVCQQIDQSQCVNLYSVTLDDGTVLYRRQG